MGKDVCTENPKRNPSGPRTALFGPQRTPLNDSTNVLRAPAGSGDRLLLYCIPYLMTNHTNADGKMALEISAAAEELPFSKADLESMGMAVTVEDECAFQERKKASQEDSCKWYN